MSDFDRLVHLQWAVFCVVSARVEGAFVEIGCNSGRTSVYLAELLRHFGQTDRRLHLYDSFKGLPAPSAHDAYFSQGDLRASLEEVREQFAFNNLPPPEIHPGWLHDTLPIQLPSKVAFGYIDVDFYDSTKHALTAVYDRLSPGALVIVDDYADHELNPRAWDFLKGVKIACDDVTSAWPERFQVLCSSGNLAFGLLRKL